MPILFIEPGNLEWGGKAFLYAVEQVHLPGLIIAGVLLILSITSWGVMASKMALLSRTSQRNYRFIYAFRKTGHALELHEKNAHTAGSPLSAIYRTAARELSLHRSQTPPPRGFDGEAKITPEQMTSVRRTMDRVIGETMLSLESRMNILATSVSGAPFLGLLGTAWGVMEAFSGMASSGSTAASIQSMAPGVSAALVTTIIGLLVAIPAMFGYNFIVNRIRFLALEMHNFAAELAAIFERENVEYRAVATIQTQSPATHPGLQPTTTIPGYMPRPGATQAYPQRPYRDTNPVPVHGEPPASFESFPAPNSPHQSSEWGGVPINPIAQQSYQKPPADTAPHPTAEYLAQNPPPPLRGQPIAPQTPPPQPGQQQHPAHPAPLVTPRGGGGRSSQ